MADYLIIQINDQILGAIQIILDPAVILGMEVMDLVEIQTILTILMTRLIAIIEILINKDIILSGI